MRCLLDARWCPLLVCVWGHTSFPIWQLNLLLGLFLHIPSLPFPAYPACVRKEELASSVPRCPDRDIVDADAVGTRMGTSHTTAVSPERDLGLVPEQYLAT